MEILFFCDDLDDATIFSDAINEIDSGIVCTILSSKIEATSALSEINESQIVFLDFNNLPEKFSKRLIRFLRNDARWRDVKIVIYTNSFEITSQKREELIKLGANDFLIKTSDLSAMRSSILHFLK